MRRTGLPLMLALVGLLSVPQATAPRFYPDDPVWTEPDTQAASKVAPNDFDLDEEGFERQFGYPDRVANVRAQNVNTVDEVPDSGWYTNRCRRRPLTPEEVLRGANTSDGPADGMWTVISAIRSGNTPGFAVRDVKGEEWFIKFDPSRHHEMATGADAVATRLLWALGYNVPENHIATVRASQLILDPAATIQTAAGRRPMHPADVSKLLKLSAVDGRGDYRVLASRRIPGRALGSFSFHATRRDDPNDFVPHEHRRELRAYGTFAAWLDHLDVGSTNTFDVVVESGGKAAVKHYLQHFGSAIVSDGMKRRATFSSLAFGVQPWRVPSSQTASTARFPIAPERWDPDRWRPRSPNPAFLQSRLDDKFWAARGLQALTPPVLAAAVQSAEYSDPQATEMVLQFLIHRRAAILQRYLTAVNPVTDVRLDRSATLTFRNAAVEANVADWPRSYRAVWWRFDNSTSALTPLGATRSHLARLRPPVPISLEREAFIRIDISADSDAHFLWADPAHAYFRSDGHRWALVGFERVPGGNPPTPFRARPRSTDAPTR